MFIYFPFTDDFPFTHEIILNMIKAQIANINNLRTNVTDKWTSNTKKRSGRHATNKTSRTHNPTPKIATTKNL